MQISRLIFMHVCAHEHECRHIYVYTHTLVCVYGHYFSARTHIYPHDLGLDLARLCSRSELIELQGKCKQKLKEGTRHHSRPT